MRARYFVVVWNGKEPWNWSDADLADYLSAQSQPRVTPTDAPPTNTSRTELVPESASFRALMQPIESDSLADWTLRAHCAECFAEPGDFCTGPAIEARAQRVREQKVGPVSPLAFLHAIRWDAGRAHRKKDRSKRDRSIAAAEDNRPAGTHAGSRTQ